MQKAIDRNRIKLIAMDLDGTLNNDQKQITSKTKAALMLAQEKGARSSSLGRRILRTETAPLAALSILMYITGNME